ncbi:MAG TPA: DUF2314 domain-containing protein [Polyangiaceae bacterium]|jgi:hypothetical protein
MTRRTLVYLGIAVALLGTAWLLTSSPKTVPAAPDPAPSAPSVPLTQIPIPTASAPLPIRRPPSSIAEFGVLTAKNEDQLQEMIDPAALAVRVTPDLCGDTAACDAVKRTLRDDTKTTVQVLDASTWSLDKVDLDATARGLTAAEKAGVTKLPRVVVVHVKTPTDRSELALRAAIAGAAAIARDIGGVVWDQLLVRLENARTFAAHAVTTPLDAGTFRRDRVEVLFEPKSEGIVRVLTSGLSRWGEPDVEAVAVPTAATPRVSEVVLAVAQAIADGATTQPLVLTRDDVARARGQAYSADAGLPPPTPVEVDVVTAYPENGDPNDFMARIVPGAGEGPIGYVDLAERFFGRILAAAPDSDVLAFQRAKAQGKLGALVTAWEAQKAGGAKLLVMLPFTIPGDAGIESMWIEVTRADTKTVTGKVLDDPLGATDVKHGDEVTRPRSQVEDVELRGAKP